MYVIKKRLLSILSNIFVQAPSSIGDTDMLYLDRVSAVVGDLLLVGDYSDIYHSRYAQLRCMLAKDANILTYIRDMERVMKHGMDITYVRRTYNSDKLLHKYVITLFVEDGVYLEESVDTLIRRFLTVTEQYICYIRNRLNDKRIDEGDIVTSLSIALLQSQACVLDLLSDFVTMKN